MSWFYAEAGVQKGPIDQDTFAHLVQSGVISGTTLVWREGMDDWRPYGEITAGTTTAESSAMSAVAASNSAAVGAATPVAAAHTTADVVACVECGATFPKSETVAYAGRHVCAGCRDAFFQKVREGAYSPGSGKGAPLVYASFGVRWGAKIIDGVLITTIQTVIVLPFMFLVMSRMSTQGPQSGEAMLWLVALQMSLYLVQFTIVFLFKGIFYGRWGATPGKMALGLRVVRPDGASLQMGRAFGRAGAEILNGFTLYIGYLIAAFDEERRGLHDRICDTRVIRVR